MHPLAPFLPPLPFPTPASPTPSANRISLPYPPLPLYPLTHLPLPSPATPAALCNPHIPGALHLSCYAANCTARTTTRQRQPQPPPPTPQGPLVHPLATFPLSQRCATPASLAHPAPSMTSPSATCLTCPALAPTHTPLPHSPVHPRRPAPELVRCQPNPPALICPALKVPVPGSGTACTHSPTPPCYPRSPVQSPYPRRPALELLRRHLPLLLHKVPPCLINEHPRG